MQIPTTRGVDYNTQRPQLPLPEYGRCLQQMVDYAKTIEDKEERQACACTIVELMRGMTDWQGSAEDVQKKLWNHIAAMSGYELDVDYPVEIKRMDGRSTQGQRPPYPGKKIKKAHYGAILEALTKQLARMDEGPEREELATRIANQMKRDLARWNQDAMSEEKVMDDLAAYTDGRVSLLPGEVRFKSDSDIRADVQQMTPSRRRKQR